MKDNFLINNIYDNKYNNKYINNYKTYNYDSGVQIKNYGKFNRTSDYSNSQLIGLLKTSELLVLYNPSILKKSMENIMDDISDCLNGSNNYLQVFSKYQLFSLFLSLSSFDNSIYYNMPLSSVLLVLSAKPNATQSTNPLGKDNNQNPINTTSQDDKQEAMKILEEENKKIIDGFMEDILSVPGSVSFRGWMLPNGQLMSQYNEKSSRQDHSRLFDLFMMGLEKYDIDSYYKIKDLYLEYQKENTYGDIGESFAVERLGWMQIAVNGSKKVMYRAERWQDRLLRPFLVDLGFNYEIADNGICHDASFSNLYDHIDEIIKLAVEEKYARKLK